MPETGRIICIFGTDTDAGKTVLTAALLRACLNRALTAQAVKPVQTGCLAAAGAKGNVAGAAEALLAPDVLVYNDAAPEAEAFALSGFQDACSPHLAAGRAGRRLTAVSMAAALRAVAKKARITLVEAAGGLLAPLNRRECMADIAVRLQAPVLLAVPNRLGAVNHALLSFEAMRARGIEPAGFVMIGQPASGGAVPDRQTRAVANAIHKDNPECIARMGQVPCLAELPHLPALSNLSHLSNMSAQAARAGEPGRKKAWAELARLLEPALAALDVPASSATHANGSHGCADRVEELLAYDREHLWHPYTSALAPLKTWLAARTEGPYIWLRDTAEKSGGAGRRPVSRKVVDGMSSWWSAIHGYNQPRILKALRKQAQIMPHVMFGGITHEPAVTLAQKLLSMAPAGLEHVFLADSGSVSVEAALKMAVQYQQAVGQAKKSLALTVCGGYHGDTLGAMSVCDPANGMHGLFSSVLPRQIFAPRPECRFDQPYDPAAALPVERLFREQAGRVAALIIEPVVQGAGGMWFYHPNYLRRLRELCSEHGALLILDEIATGFGRTGKLFACEWAGITPDIMCVGKALTGGAMTLAATLATREVALGISRAGGAFMHGPTFMGNPLACSVAVASLSLLGDYPWQERVRRIETQLKQGLEPCRGLRDVRDVRVLGAIGVVELERPVSVEKLQDFFVRQCGVWLRPFGRLIYAMPPYVTPEDEMHKLAAAIVRAVETRAWA